MTASASSPFRPELFDFLRDLAANNRRDWFQENRERYESSVKDAALTFISDFGPHLRRISPHFTAIPKVVGGSLFRIYRDVRFARDRAPYKTNCAMQFRHERAKDIHAPGFYLSLSPEEVYVGGGIYHPPTPVLTRIREAIAADPATWRRASAGRAVVEAGLALGGDSLKRAPKGFPADHPQIDDLKRKDYFLAASLTERDAVGDGFLARYADLCRAAAPLVRFLCRALDLPF
ncbi:MAG: DUF2461 domain-containing protein [Thermoanaerobaculia bacterium]|nr:DUF2461 domain-containing protein [Thermoanaerobaculia bacterium]